MDWARALPVIVQFGVGSLLCLLGIWAGLRSGYLDLALPQDRRSLWIVAGGFLALLLVACAFTFWLPFIVPPREMP